MEAIAKQLPGRRIGRADEIARAVLMLMTNDYTTARCCTSTAPAGSFEPAEIMTPQKGAPTAAQMFRIRARCP